jgi:3-hydroxyacyl-[acyl-carrier protein] dehydratase/trans-2-decenoyl-[acyl-carrier protein] isomerase
MLDRITDADHSVETGFRVKDRYTLEELNHFSLHGPGGGHEWPRLPNGRWRLFDEIAHIAGSPDTNTCRIAAQYRVSPESWFFEGHFPGFPAMPGVLLQDALLQLTGFAAAWLGYRGPGLALGVDKIRYRSSVTPSTLKIRYEVEINSIKEKLGGFYVYGKGTAYADDERAAVADQLSVLIKPM